MLTPYRATLPANQSYRKDNMSNTWFTLYLRAQEEYYMLSRYHRVSFRAVKLMNYCLNRYLKSLCN